jgi:ABC-2 type transport system ATP-binding protein
VVLTAEAVQVDQLTKRFGHFMAVDRISFRVAPGEIFGLLGPNGAGKSTTIRMLCGIVTPSSGSGHVGGHDIFTQPERIKQSIGYMSQKFSLYTDMTPLENIRFYLGIYNVPQSQWAERIQWVLSMTRLRDVGKRLTAELPPGWRQRLALGCALLHRPPILFLDEPTSGVDPLTRRQFWHFIGQLAADGITVFVTTHYMDEARHCHRLVMINEGRIAAAGTPAQIVQDQLPDQPGADLNDAFIKLMARRSQ